MSTNVVLSGGGRGVIFVHTLDRIQINIYIEIYIYIYLYPYCYVVITYYYFKGSNYFSSFPDNN